MNKLLPILLLLASCGSQGGGENGAGEGGGAPPAGGQPVLPAAPDLAALQAKVERAMASALPDAAGAQYRALRAGAGGSACGEVVTAGKGPLAGIARPFIVTPDGVAVVAEGPAIAWEDPDDFVADAWIRWCATPEELERLRPQLERAAAESVNSAAAVPDAGPDLPLPPVLGEEAPVAAPPVPAEPAPPPRKSSPPPPPRIDSFFNSVDRAQ
ncbi:MAG TPA: hypothetical protein VGB48_09230 [Allosphingosinicella sp.]|jgi:hypothetical protein